MDALADLLLPPSLLALASTNSPRRTTWLDAIQVETVIVGAGQCGLSVGYYLKKQGQISSSWMNTIGLATCGGDDTTRCASTPLLATTAFPAWRFRPTWGVSHRRTDGRLPRAIRSELRFARQAWRQSGECSSVEGTDGRFQVTAGDQTYLAHNLVVAVGSQRVPKVPAFAGQLDPDIRQFHSDDYRNTGQLPDGSVLIVGASHSGADIAMECAPDHHTWLCGPDRGQLPVALEGRATRVLRPALWFAASHVLTMRTPIGKKMRHEIRTTGGPLLRYRREDLETRGRRAAAKTASSGVDNGFPVLDDGTRLEPANVIWCTGYGRDFDWLTVPYPREDEWPQQERGVVPEVPGLYFMGLLFQFAFTSMLIGGAEREAKHVATHIAKSRKAGRPASQKVAA